MNQPELPPTTPLPIATLDDARMLQDRLVRAACQELPGAQLFTTDAGVTTDLGRPHATAAIERVLAHAFNTPASCLVQGAGTGAIRTGLSIGPWHTGRRTVVVHDAPIYPTTHATFTDGQAKTVPVDFEDLDAVHAALAAQPEGSWVYIQHTRQRLADRHDPLVIVELAKTHGHNVLVDDNYAAVRTLEIGAARGADLSAFSLFKLHGPPGVGVVLGNNDLIDRAHRQNYSGGGQVQGNQALTALQRLVGATTAWAEQSQQAIRLHQLLLEGAVPHITDARLVNAQDLCVLALLATPSVEQVRKRAAVLGAAPYPVGSNSFYELAPLIYRLSSTTLRAYPHLKKWVLRINPMRASAEHVIELLSTATRP